MQASASTDCRSPQRIVGLRTWNPADGLIYADPEVAELYSVPADSALRGASLEAYLERVHPDDRGEVQASFGLAVRLPVPYAREYRVWAPDGELRRVRALGRCFRSGGRPMHFPAVIVDVTDRAETRAPLEVIADHCLQAREVADAAGLSFLRHLIDMAIIETGALIARGLRRWQV